MNTCDRGSLLIALLLVMGGMGCASAEDSTTQTRRDRAAEADDPSGILDIVSLDESTLIESSGLAASLRRQEHFWSHNDSGGEPRLFAFDSSGSKTGQLRLRSAEMIDWEDMASFTDGDVPRLLIADCGDNLAARSSITLYLLDEPNPRHFSSCEAEQTISVVYPDGPRDCEAVAVDAVRRQIILISKTVFPTAGVYAVPLPNRVNSAEHTTITAKRIGTLAMPVVTAMDIDQSNGDVWIVSYFQAFHFKCATRSMPIDRQIMETPLPYELPRWRQIESIAIDASHDVWVTSEGSPAPMGRLPTRVNPREHSERP